MTIPQPVKVPNSPPGGSLNSGDNRLAVATALIAKARADCADIGVSPGEFAELLLPEALLAMMIQGMTQEEVEDTFARFAREEIAAWFFRVKRVAGYCDCEREALADHALHCNSRRETDRGLIRPKDEKKTFDLPFKTKSTTGGSQ